MDSKYFTLEAAVTQLKLKSVLWTLDTELIKDQASLELLSGCGLRKMRQKIPNCDILGISLLQDGVLGKANTWVIN